MEGESKGKGEESPLFPGRDTLLSAPQSFGLVAPKVRRRKAKKEVKVHSREWILIPSGPERFDLLTCGDKKVLKWSQEGEGLGALFHDDEGSNEKEKSEKGSGFYVCLDFCSVGGADALAAGMSDGNIKLLFGKEEKKITQAHKAPGSCICLRWSFDGEALASGGEDGCVKIWSRAGMLRAQLCQLSSLVPCLAWSPDGDSVLCAGEKHLYVKPLSGVGSSFQTWKQGGRAKSWKAHDGVILCLDWSPVSGLMVSGGEDCRFKIWDRDGGLLFASSHTEFDSAVLSAKWAPNSSMVALGSFEQVHLFDSSGASVCAPTSCSAGGVMEIKWAPDGTRLAFAGGQGVLGMGSLSERFISEGPMEVYQAGPQALNILDASCDMDHTLEFRERVIDFVLANRRLIVLTSSQCVIHPLPSAEGQGGKGQQDHWPAPSVEDLKEVPSLISTALSGFFCMPDSKGVHVYTYEGRRVSSIHVSGGRTDSCSENTLSISPETVALVDRSNPCRVLLFEAASGKPTGSLVHKEPVIQVSLDQLSIPAERQLAFLDQSKELYLVKTQKLSVGSELSSVERLGSMVDSFVWNSLCPSLTAISDGRLQTWLAPDACFTDRSLLPSTVESKPLDLKGGGRVKRARGPLVDIKRTNGGEISVGISPYPEVLYKLVGRGDWEMAVKLCRFVKLRELWATLTVLALKVGEFSSLEMAMAGIQEISKVHYLRKVSQCPPLVRQAEVGTLARRPDDAVRLLLQGRKVYRAIKTLIRLHRWESALDLSVQQRTHVDTVLAYRQRHLAAMNHKETNEKFSRYAQEVSFDWTTVKAKIRVEKEAEAGQ